MGRGRLRSWWSLGAVAVIAVIVGWLLYLLFRARGRDDLSTYGAFALPVILVVAGWLGWAWRKGKASASAGPASGQALDQAADQLAAAVLAQWNQAAEERGLIGADPIRVTWGRPSQAMAGPADAAIGSHRFDPLPGLTEAGEADLAAGDASDLHALYGGLRSGRLIIAGPPGAGKTGAAVLLVLEALRYRDHLPPAQRPQVPIPVLFTAQDWDPVGDPAAHWLTGKLQDTYPLLHGAAGAATAAALLAAGRISVIVDGLDEISPEQRPVALRALSQQATFRLVILSRTAEMATAAARQGVLHGAAAIELKQVSPDDAAAYLQRVQLDPPPAGWRELTRRILTARDSPLSRALNSPLSLTLVRDTYHGEDIRELLDYCDTLISTPADLAVEAITDHLLDRVLPAAYTPHPGRPLPYDLATAQQTLTMIAARMNQDGTRDLNWWEIPAWAPRPHRFIATAITIGPVCGLAFGLGVGLRFGLEAALLLGLVVGLAGGLGGGYVSGFPARPHVIGDLRPTKLLNRKNFTAGLGSGLAIGVAVGLASGLAPGLTAGVLCGLVVWFAFGVDDALTADTDSGGTLNPATSWRRNQGYGLVSGLPVGLIVGLATGFTAGITAGLVDGLAFGFMSGLLGTETYPVSLAAVQLSHQWHTPVPLMRFLNDAYSRNVLRAVGPSYQFRHARLQDRLAAAACPRGSGAPAAAITAGRGT